MSVIREKQPMVLHSGKYWRIRSAISRRREAFSTKGLAPVKKVRVICWSFHRSSWALASFRSLLMVSSGVILNWKGKSSYKVQNLQRWWVQPAVTSSSMEAAS